MVEFSDILLPLPPATGWQLGSVLVTALIVVVALYGLLRALLHRRNKARYRLQRLMRQLRRRPAEARRVAHALAELRRRAGLPLECPDGGQALDRLRFDAREVAVDAVLDELKRTIDRCR